MEEEGMIANDFGFFNLTLIYTYVKIELEQVFRFKLSSQAS